jgi:hypothetical protein
MTLLNIAGGQATPAALGIATVGIISGAVVIVILGISTIFAIYYRRSPKQKLVNPVYHDEAVEVRHNPVRAPLERQRSMSYPTEPEIVVPKPTPTAMKNPFAPKGINTKFAPTMIRLNYDLPPPPPPMEEV